MRIIIDTNLWISFMLGRKIATMRTLLTHPSLEIYVCRELLDEFYDVSSREKIRKQIRPEDLDDTLKLTIYTENMSSSKQKANQRLETKKIFICSLQPDTIKANYIVTGDKDLLVLEKHNRTKIATITEFMKLLQPSHLEEDVYRFKLSLSINISIIDKMIRVQRQRHM